MYVAVKGGEKAIAAAHALLARERRGDVQIPEVTLEQLAGQLKLAVDRIMAEGSLYSPELAALAFKQAQGDAVEAIFLLRAYRTTLPRFGVSEPMDTSRMRVERRISATWKDLPGGQVLLILPPCGTGRRIMTPRCPLAAIPARRIRLAHIITARAQAVRIQAASKAQTATATQKAPRHRRRLPVYLRLFRIVPLLDNLCDLFAIYADLAATLPERALLLRRRHAVDVPALGAAILPNDDLSHHATSPLSSSRMADTDSWRSSPVTRSPSHFHLPPITPLKTGRCATLHTRKGRNRGMMNHDSGLLLGAEQPQYKI